MELTLKEVNQLKTELFGWRNPETGELLFKGILGQKIPFKLKFWLQSQLINQLESFDKLVKEKHLDVLSEFDLTTDDLGRIVSINKEMSEEELDVLIQKSDEKMKSFADSEKVDIKFSVKVEMFEDLDFEEYYPVLMKFVTEDAIA